MSLILVVLERMVRDKGLTVAQRKAAYKLLKDIVNHTGLIRYGVK